jgi:hypothetical protein
VWPVERSLGRLAGVGGHLDRTLTQLAASRALGEPPAADRRPDRPSTKLVCLPPAAPLVTPTGRPGALDEALVHAEALEMRQVGAEAVRREPGSAPPSARRPVSPG